MTLGGDPNIKSEYCQQTLRITNEPNLLPLGSKSSTYAFENPSLDHSLISSDNSQVFDKDSSPDIVITNHHFAKYMTKQELVKKLERVTGELVQPIIIRKELFFINSTEDAKTAFEIELTDDQTQVNEE
uniref:Ras-associating domain-containing protein n=1 Tax=Strongyloides stercoralis TaxID=6248 RepID=A0A0K0E8F1_STRER